MSEINKEEYTPISYQEFEKIVDNAREVYENENATQDEVDAAINALKTAEEVLVKKADKQLLDEIIKEAQGLQKELYEDFSFLEQTLEEGKAIQSNENATQKDVDIAVEAIKEAIKELKYKSADYTELNQAMKVAEGLQKEDYTEETWGALEEAMNKAKAVQGLDIRKQEEVDRAASQLKEAIDNLKLKEDETVDKSNLYELLGKYDGYKAKDYTAASWKPFKEAYDAACEVYLDENATQEEVIEAYEALQKAAMNLKKAADNPNEDPAEGELTHQPDKDTTDTAASGMNALPMGSGRHPFICINVHDLP